MRVSSTLVRMYSFFWNSKQYESSLLEWSATPPPSTVGDGKDLGHWNHQNMKFYTTYTNLSRSSHGTNDKAVFAGRVPHSPEVWQPSSCEVVVSDRLDQWDITQVWWVIEPENRQHQSEYTYQSVRETAPIRVSVTIGQSHSTNQNRHTRPGQEWRTTTQTLLQLFSKKKYFNRSNSLPEPELNPPQAVVCRAAQYRVACQWREGGRQNSFRAGQRG